jgi:murein DD-endopeptidase MepM/ murein hydrolase activator NlpD
MQSLTPQRSAVKRVATVVAIVGIALVTAFAQTTSKQLEQLQRDLRAAQTARDNQAARANTLEGEIRNLSAQENRLAGQVKALNERLTKLETEREFVQGQLNKTQKKSDALELEIKTLSAKIDYQKIQVSRLIVSLDRERSNRYVKLLARAENAFDLAVKTKDLDTIQDVNLNVIQELKTNVAQRNAKNLEYVAVIAKLNEYQRKLEAKRVDITKNRTQLNSSIAQLRQTQAGRKVLLLQAIRAQQAASAQASSIFQGIVKERQRLAEIRRQRAEEARRRRLAEEKRKREEAARIAAIRDAQERERQKQFEAQRQSQANAEIEAIKPIPLPASIGRLLFPISGGRITSDFGEEGDWMTITASQAGAPVLAAADGQIMAVRLQGANYGYSILIAHTDSFDVITGYSNLQAPLVGFGQSIRAGQVIGYTGGGTLIPANDLHFSVARNNVNVNPRAYF